MILQDGLLGAEVSFSNRSETVTGIIRVVFLKDGYVYVVVEERGHFIKTSLESCTRTKRVHKVDNLPVR